MVKILMVSSVLLLTIFQFVWIRSAYEKAYSGLRREANIIFRSTALSLRNQLFTQSMVQISTDSLEHNFPQIVADSSFKRKELIRGRERFEMRIERKERDSIVHDTAITEVHSPAFIIRMNADTVVTDTLRAYYQSALRSANIDLPSTVTHDRVRPAAAGAFPIANFRHVDEPMGDVIYEASKNFYTDSITTEPFRVTAFHSYKATIYGVRLIIAKKVSSEIIFSLILTITITLALFTMYKNIKNQERLIALKNDLISNISHELKTPVSTVSVALEALRNFNVLNDQKQSREYLDIAQTELQRLNNITDKILSSSLVEQKAIATDQATDVLKIVKDVHTNMDILFKSRNAKVSLESSGSNFLIHCGHSELYQVVENLLDNALKYSPTEPVIIINVIDAADHIILMVKDKGIGIGKEFHSMIFEKFFRVQTGDVHTTKGYGLGLSYVAEVVRALGGTVSVESEPGKGSKFTVVFPRLRKSN